MIHAIDTSKAKYDGLLSSLQNCYDIVKANRKELTPSDDTESSEDNEEAPETEKKSDEIDLI